jgi:hypothetical protein
MTGYCYVLTNPYMPGLVKAGMTDRSPYLRAAELSAPTGVPGHYRVERFWALDDAAAAERRVHAALAQYRVSGEHFRLPVADAVSRIEAVLAAARPELRLFPTWHVAASRAAAVVLLILSLWPAFRRLQRQLRALRSLLRAGRL